MALLRKLGQRLAAQEGFALVASIGMSLVLGIAGTTAMVYTTQNQASAARSKADLSALALAEAGLNNAYSTLYNASDPTQPGAVPQRSEQLESGTATYYGTLDTATNVWTLIGVGRLANPTPGADVVRTVRGRVRLGSSTRGTSNNAIWNYVYADDTTTCTTLKNSVNVNVPFYVRGSLCLQNTSQVSGYALQVGGTVTISQSGTIGTAGSPIAEVHIAGGCALNGATLHNPCGTADRVYGQTVDSVTTNLTKPPVDLAYWYANAKPGPLQGCTTGSFPGGFDTDTTMNVSLREVDLTPDLTYDCQVLDAQGTLIGRIAWTGGSTGTLTVAGTIFIDGNIAFKQYVNAVYQGRATIYASGSIEIRNSTTLCGVAGCGTNWQPTQNLLAFVAGGSPRQGEGFVVRNLSTFQGAIYAVYDYSEENNATVWGPIIARQLYFSNSTTNFYVPIGTLLPGMPATYEEAVTLTNDPGSWG